MKNLESLFAASGLDAEGVGSIAVLPHLVRGEAMQVAECGRQRQSQLELALPLTGVR